MTEYAKKLLRLYHEQSKKNRIIEGSLPLNFKGKGKDLKNYRIYGNTVNGESVGDRTANLFDGEIEQGSFNGRTGAEVSKDIRVRTTPLTITPNTFTINANGVDKVILLVYDGDTYLPNESVTEFKALPYHHTFSNNRTVRFAFGKNDNSTITTSDISNIMLNFGSTALPYEPYGYEVPVTITNGADTQTTNLYLPEPLKMVGDEAEYIDYAEQKQHRVRKNLWSGVVEQGNVSQDGVYGSDNKRIRSKNVPIEPGTYMISSNVLMQIIYAYNDDQKIGVCLNSAEGVYSQSFTVPAGANNITISMLKRVAGAQVDITPSDFIWGQIEKGSEATTYEPYIEDTELDVTLPALPTLSGTNTLSVGTEVQPSKVEIKGKIKAVQEGSGENEGE